MSSIHLQNISLTVFGESHGSMIGAVIDGLPAGEKIDMDYILSDLKRRRGGNFISTKRNEDDFPEIVSGVVGLTTTGAPLCVLIKNKDTHSNDYDNLKFTPRPSHSDYSAHVKYNGYNDIRGGGHFSGRLTAPLVFVGSLCKQILERRNIKIGAHLYNIGDVYDTPFNCINPEISMIKDKAFPTISDEYGQKMIALIEQTRDNLDSVGGSVQCAVTGLKAGYGGPLFHGIEGKLSKLLYGIPGIKGVEFGLGFDFSKSYGSEVNDEFYFENNEVRTSSNNSGGILGGISNSMPIIFRTAFKPTASIYKEQKTVDLKNKIDTTLKIKGRHDPCIAVRGLPVVEAVTAIGILDYEVGR